MSSPAGIHEKLTDRQLEILRKLYESSRPVIIRTVKKTQKKLAEELNITRQALSNHLRKLRELGFIRTGRGFIDLTDKALALLGEREGDAFVFIKVTPQYRNEVYEGLKNANVKSLYRVTGDIDLIAQVSTSKLDEFLRLVSTMRGVIETNAHVVLERLIPEEPSEESEEGENSGI
ncbi:MAG: Lrp/AsnC family transcriptional regulator [Candidatus Baldrarchaeia archaeon]